MSIVSWLYEHPFKIVFSLTFLMLLGIAFEEHYYCKNEKEEDNE